MRVGVIDYGVGNLGSVMRALEELRVAPILVTRAIDMHATDSLILPGVGNFTDCARLLDKGDWKEALRDVVEGERKPLLGVCVGMQLLASYSTEGAGAQERDRTQGLGFIPGRVEHLRTLGCGLRVPHVGWNGVTCKVPGGLFEGIPDGTDFYFVHSYAFVAEEPVDVLATADYGIPVTTAVRRDRIWGVQFHPEKSHKFGMSLLKNFADL